MKTRNLLAGIFTILVISGYAMGQELWLPDSTHIYNTNSGNVGIGTDSPGTKLDAAGEIAHHNAFVTAFGNMNTSIIGAGAGSYRSMQGSGYVDGLENQIHKYFMWRSIYGGYENGPGGYNFYSQGGYPRMWMEVISGNHGNFIGLPADSPIRSGYIYQQIKGPSGGPLSAPLEATNTNSSWLWGVQDDGDFIVDGNVGIGTTSPQGLLDVDSGSSATDALFVKAHGATGNQGGIIHHQGSTYAWQEVAQSTSSSTSGSLRFHYVNRSAPGTKQASDVLVLKGNGNVGIGTTSPQSKLAVTGTITAKEVKVTLTGWPDHVFADGYRLMPLREVADYIKANRHLPDMPSAAEVVENGVSLGDMQARLLQKVEELTLYVIGLQKENENLRERFKSLER